MVLGDGVCGMSVACSPDSAVLSLAARMLTVVGHELYSAQLPTRGAQVCALFDLPA
jgi:hypothetical protein